MKKLFTLFVAAMVTIMSMAQTETKEPTAIGGVYQISTASELAWFAQTVNDGDFSANAVLTADIIVNANVLTDHVLNDGTFSEWTPIGTSSSLYNGTFDGQGHTVSGLFNDKGEEFTGFFGNISNATIKNLGIKDTYFSVSERSGGVVGFASNVTVYGFSIENCWFDGLIEASGFDVAGILGGSWLDSDCSINNCYNLGVIKSLSTCAGGITGYCEDRTTISNCFNYGNISGTSYVGSILGQSDANVVNCYYLEGTASTGIGFHDDSDGVVASATASQFANGEICYKLNGDQSSIAFGQTIGSGLPSLSSSVVVYASYADCKSDPVYTNNSAEVIHATRTHSISSVGKVEPTSGVSHGTAAHYKCSVCGEMYSDAECKNKIDAPAVVHDIQHVDAVAAVPGVSHGTAEHYKCSVCSEKYSDAEGKNKISAPNVIHDIQHVDAVAMVPGVSHGATEHYKCSVCNKKYSDAEGKNEISAPNVIHDIQHVDAVAAVPGVSHGATEHYKCSVCYEKYSDAEGKNKISHESVCIHDFVSGICSICSIRNSEYVSTFTPDEDGIYHIATLGDLYDFVYIANNVDYSANAVLTADIIVNANVLTDHVLNEGIFSEWTPIGTLDSPYNGTFDGQGHTVSGLFNDKGEDFTGFFGHIGNATIKNLGIKDTYFSAGQKSGGVVGFAAAHDESYDFSIENCWFDGLIEASGFDVGGILGGSWSKGTCSIKDCYNLGVIKTSNNCAGGITAYCRSNTTISNCFNYGNISGTSYVGSILGQSTANVVNCYYLEGTASRGIGDYSDYDGYVESATASQFASGEICYKLNGDQSNIVYHQNLDGSSVTPDFSSTGIVILDGENYVNDASSIPTAIENINTYNSHKTFKTIENGRVVIIRDGDKWDLSGRKVE